MADTPTPDGLVAKVRRSASRTPWTEALVLVDLVILLAFLVAFIVGWL